MTFVALPVRLRAEHDLRSSDCNAEHDLSAPVKAFELSGASPVQATVTSL